MPTARATEPVTFWDDATPVALATGEEVHGDLAVRVLASDLPFEEVHETAPAKPKAPRTRTTNPPKA